MGNVFVFAVDGKSPELNSGLADEKGCRLEDVLNSIGGEVHAENIRSFYPGGVCYIWAVPDRGENHSIWELMSEGDLVLAYRAGCIISAAYVTLKIDSPTLDACLRGDGGGPSRLLCLSGKPYTGDVPILPQMERYLDREFKGFSRLRPEKCKNILSDYGSFEIFVKLGLKYDFPFSFRHSED